MSVGILYLGWSYEEEKIDYWMSLSLYFFKPVHRELQRGRQSSISLPECVDQTASAGVKAMKESLR